MRLFKWLGKFCLCSSEPLEEAYERSYVEQQPSPKQAQATLVFTPPRNPSKRQGNVRQVGGPRDGKVERNAVLKIARTRRDSPIEPHVASELAHLAEPPPRAIDNHSSSSEPFSISEQLWERPLKEILPPNRKLAYTPNGKNLTFKRKGTPHDFMRKVPENSLDNGKYTVHLGLIRDIWRKFSKLT